MQERDTLHQKSGKANFEVIYDLEDPREYFNVLGEFDYCIPQHGQRVFAEGNDAEAGGLQVWHRHHRSVPRFSPGYGRDDWHGHFAFRASWPVESGNAFCHYGNQL